MQGRWPILTVPLLPSPSDPETGTASGTSSSTAVATCASGKPLPAETVVLQKRVRLLRLVRWMLPMNTILLSTLQPFLPFGEAAIGVSATMQVRGAEDEGPKSGEEEE